MDELKRQMADIKSHKPVGKYTPIGNGYSRDDAGRIYKQTPIEVVQAIRKSQAIKRDRRHFSFTHMRYVREVTDNLSNNYCGYLLMLQPYIQFRSNILVDKKGKPLTRNELAKAIGVTPRTMKTLIENFEQDDIIEITDEGYFRMNTRYHFRKKAGSERGMLVKTFFTTLKDLKLKPAEMGALYKLLPYVHYETNMICANPFEEVPANIRFLSTKEVAEVIGVHEKKAIQLLRELKRAGAVAETTRFSEDLRVKFLTLNPFIFFRQSGQPDITLQAMFLSKQNK